MLQIKEDDKFFSRLLSKESSMVPSFRVYYGGTSGAVPFGWEATPGTPKHSKLFPHEEDRECHGSLSLPPLTPPPSYCLNQSKKTSPSGKRSRILQGLIPKMIMHRRQISSVSSSSSLSSSSDSTTTTKKHHKRSHSFSSPGSLFDFMPNDKDVEQDDEEDDEEMSSPKSTLCFGIVGSRKIRTSSTSVGEPHKV